MKLGKALYVSTGVPLQNFSTNTYMIACMATAPPKAINPSR
ncbi:hypothetical protein [Photobacterium damselae]